MTAVQQTENFRPVCLRCNRRVDRVDAYTDRDGGVTRFRAFCHGDVADEFITDQVLALSRGKLTIEFFKPAAQPDWLEQMRAYQEYVNQQVGLQALSQLQRAANLQQAEFLARALGAAQTQPMPQQVTAGTAQQWQIFLEEIGARMPASQRAVDVLREPVLVRDPEEAIAALTEPARRRLAV